MQLPAGRFHTHPIYTLTEITAIVGGPDLEDKRVNSAPWTSEIQV